MEAIAHAAMNALARLYPEGVRRASADDLEAATAAMRAKVAEALDELMRDLREAPHVGEYAMRVAALTIAQAGIEALKARGV